MGYFRVMLHGDGILCETDDSPTIIGFYTTRIVRAPSEEEAKVKATALVRNQWTTGAEAKWNRGSLPLLTVETTEPISLWMALFFRNKGHTFYSDESSSG